MTECVHNRENLDISKQSRFKEEDWKLCWSGAHSKPQHLFRRDIGPSGKPLEMFRQDFRFEFLQQLPGINSSWREGIDCMQWEHYSMASMSRGFGGNSNFSSGKRIEKMWAAANFVYGIICVKCSSDSLAANWEHWFVCKVLGGDQLFFDRGSSTTMAVNLLSKYIPFLIARPGCFSTYMTREL